MATRDYAKESEWRKKKYKRLVADIDPETHQRFKAKLAKDKTTFSEWLTDRISDYLK